VSQFFDEAESIAVGVSHDATACPLVSGMGVNHNACWKTELPSDCPFLIKKQLNRALTGEKVNGLLSPGRLYAGKLYTFNLILPRVSEKDESVVFHEDRYMRMLLRKRGLFLKRLAPGTFLKINNQQWVVSTEWDERYFWWQAQSVATGLFFRWHTQTIEVAHGHGTQRECKRLTDILTSQIPSAAIVEYDKLREQILLGLMNRGYTETSPECELRVIEQSEHVFRYGVFPVERFQREALCTYFIEITELECADAVLEW
jgi:hypothetical protein